MAIIRESTVSLETFAAGVTREAKRTPPTITVTIENGGEEDGKINLALLRRHKRLGGAVNVAEKVHVRMSVMPETSSETDARPLWQREVEGAAVRGEELSEIERFREAGHDVRAGLAAARVTDILRRQFPGFAVAGVQVGERGPILHEPQLGLFARHARRSGIPGSAPVAH